MLNMYELTTFVTVISEGSMTAAADKLFLTQPAVSQQIRNLEQDLGVEILVRGTRQVKPTLQGEILYDYAKKVLQLVNQTELAIKTMSARLEGHMRVGTLNSIGLQIVSPIVGRLLKHNPKLNIKIDYNKGEDLVESFRQGQLDILILPEFEKEYGESLPGAEKKLLQNEEMWLVGPGRDSSVPKKISFAQYTQMPIVTFTGEYPAFHKKVADLTQKFGLKVQSVFESSNVGTLKKVIESGLGWGFLPSHSIRKQVKMGRMTRVVVEELSYDISLMYYYRQSMENNPIKEVFFQALQHQERM
ncbi:MAG: LysR family transcriptional regulator [Pseudobdellovibrionaceae bacterium]